MRVGWWWWEGGGQGVRVAQEGKEVVKLADIERPFHTVGAAGPEKR